MAIIRVNGKTYDYAEFEDIIKPMWKKMMEKEGGRKDDHDVPVSTV